jgi:hypothetical protein
MKLHIENSIVIENNGRTTTLGKGEYEFDSASEFIKFVEGLGEQPKQPYIKDEKIRKAVRAWAEMNDIRFIRMCSRTRKENARIVGQNALGRTFTMEIDNEYEIRVSFEDYKECYTLAELCGEEEE